MSRYDVIWLQAVAFFLFIFCSLPLLFLCLRWQRTFRPTEQCASGDIRQCCPYCNKTQQLCDGVRYFLPWQALPAIERNASRFYYYMLYITHTQAWRPVHARRSCLLLPLPFALPWSCVAYIDIVRGFHFRLGQPNRVDFWTICHGRRVRLVCTASVTTSTYNTYNTYHTYMAISKVLLLGNKAMAQL